MQGAAYSLFLSLLFLSSLEGAMAANRTSTSSDYFPSNLTFFKESQDSISPSEQVVLLIEIAEKKKGAEPTIAAALAEEAKRLASDFGLDKSLANAEHILGEIKWNQAKYEEAVAYFYQASSLREQIRDSIGIVDSDLQIGNIYFHQKHYVDAEYFYNKASQICEKIDYKKGKTDAAIALGNLCLEKEKGDEVRTYAAFALKEAQEMDYPEGEISALSLIGQQFLKTGDYENAHANLSLALEKIRHLNDQYQLMKILPLVAVSLTGVPKSQSKAEALIKESLNLSREMKLPLSELAVLTSLVQFYEKNSNFEKAYAIEKQRYNLHLEVIEMNKERSMAEVLVSYLSREKRVAELQSANEILKNKQEISHLYLVTTFVLVFSIFIIVGVLVSQLRFKSKSNLLLAEKNKELIEINAALERFAYVASHDLKEPLRTISSFTSLIARKYQPLLDNKGKEYIKFIVEGAAHMNYLLEDLLRYSRLVNKKEFVSEPVNLNQIVASVEKVLRKNIEEKNALIQYPDMPVVYSNSIHMHQLFQNLIANGLKFNNKENPKVEITCTPEENRYLISIKDNGIGIDQQYHGKIFEMFHRLSKSEYAGTGIGLSICQKIIEMNEGKLWLESTPGEGTTFFFYLPMDRAN